MGIDGTRREVPNRVAALGAAGLGSRVGTTVGQASLAFDTVSKLVAAKANVKARVIMVLALACALWCGVAAELALAQTATDMDMEFRMYFPTGSSTAADPLRLEITVDVNGTPTTKIVEVAGITKWGKPDRAGQTGQQYLQTLADSAAIASQGKAEIILIRINQAFAAEFAQLDGGKGRFAEFGTYAQSLTFNPNPNSETKIIPAGPRDRLKADGEFGLVNIPSATKIRVLSRARPEDRESDTR